MVQFRMEDADKIVEQPVGMEGCLLIERALLDVAAIDLLTAEGLELGVAMMLGA